MKIFFYIFLPLLLFSSATGAKEYTLPDLLNSIFSDQHLINAAKLRIQEAQYLTQQSGGVANPDLEIALGRRNIGAQSGLAFETTYTQKIMYPGKLELNKKVADFDFELAQLKLSETEIYLYWEITRLAYTYEINRAYASFIQHRQQQFEWVKLYLQHRVIASPQKKLEVIIIENKLRDLNYEHLLAQAMVRTSFAALNVYAQFAEDELPSINLKVVDKIENSKTETAWLNLILQNNPVLKQEQNRFDQAQQRIKWLDLQAQPDFDVNLRYSNATAIDTEEQLMAGLRLELPFKNRNGNAIQAQAQSAQVIEKQKLFLEQQIKTQASELFWQLNTARQIMKTYTPQLTSQMEQSSLVAFNQFKKDQVELLSLLELENQLTANYLHRLEAQKQFINAYTHLLELADIKESL